MRGEKWGVGGIMFEFTFNIGGECALTILLALLE